MKAVVYVRCATAQQSDKNMAIEYQKRECIRYAIKKGYLVDERQDVYEDVCFSGLTTDRPALNYMLDRCMNDEEIKVVIVKDIARLGRNNQVIRYIENTLEKYGIEIHTITDGLWNNSPQNKFLEKIMSALAEFQSFQHGQKIRAGLAHKKLVGKRKK